MRKCAVAGLIVLLVFIVSCQSDSYYMTATINGQECSNSSADAELTARFRKGIDLAGLVDVGYLQIRALDRNPERIEEIALYVTYVETTPHPRVFNLDPRFRDPGLSPALASITFHGSATPLNTSYGGGGKIRILEITDEYVSGEFAFVVFDDRGNPITVSNGSFKVPVIE